jgi:carboxylate-amine ligase
VLWNRDQRIARRLIAALAARGDLVVGDNEPYDARDGHGYTMTAHCERAGLPHALLEIRQDLIDTREGASRWATILEGRCAPILADRALRRFASAAVSDPPFTVGIEEEYLLVRPRSRTSPPRRRPRCAPSASAARRQVSAPSSCARRSRCRRAPHRSVGEARTDLARLRRTIAEVAAPHGLAPIAAATHPFADWSAQKADRPPALPRARERPAGRRPPLLICGLHVHVGIEDEELRIDLMNQVGYLPPHLLALSTSVAVLARRGHRAEELPAVGVQPSCRAPACPTISAWAASTSATSRCSVAAGLIEDAQQAVVGRAALCALPDARDARHRHHPASTTRSRSPRCSSASCSMLWRLRARQPALARLPACWSGENRWRAQRYGIDEGLVDFGKGRIVLLRRAARRADRAHRARRAAPRLRGRDRLDARHPQARHLGASPARRRSTTRWRQAPRAPTR